MFRVINSSKCFKFWTRAFHHSSTAFNLWCWYTILINHNQRVLGNNAVDVLQGSVCLFWWGPGQMDFNTPWMNYSVCKAMLIYFINFISWIMRLIPSFNGRDIFKVQIDYAIDYEQNPVHYNSQPGTCGDCGHLIKTILLMDVEGCHTWCNMESCERVILQIFFRK